MNSKILQKKNILLIGGPTASGKSKLALDIATSLNGEIINCDSMQVYKYFKILTSQPKNNTVNNIRHHLYGFLETDKNYNAAKWLKDVNFIIKNILKNNKIPILVGGTGLYFEFLSKGVHYIPLITREVKDRIIEEMKREGVNSLYEKLMALDYEYAKKISPNDTQRILRGIEVFYQTKKTITYYYTKEKLKSEFQEIRILLLPDRSIIKLNCKNRFLKMIDEGLVEEINKNRHRVFDCNIVNAIGYKEIIDFLDNKITLNFATESAVRKTKRYAKRQRTWFSKRFDPHFIINSVNQNSLLLESLTKIN